MSNKQVPEPLRFKSLEGWIRWLDKHHRTAEVAWLVFRKKGQGPVPFDYQMALDEALCYGWVDSLLKTIDEAEYMRKFAPRKPSSTWSENNKRSVERLSGEGRMKEAGLKTIEAGKKSGMWDKGVKPPEVDKNLPGALLNAFRQHPEARAQYFRMPQNQQIQYNIWINMARRPETVRRRVEEALQKLERGEELGLK
jgi:uncharacterized protein YdeI (YjbR/CyaY-like superfamily)